MSERNHKQGPEIRICDVQNVEANEQDTKACEKKIWIQGWSNVLRVATKMTDPKSFKAVISAALDSGWDMWQPLAAAEGNGFEKESYPLPVLISNFWPTVKEENSNPDAVSRVKILTELGIDWNQTWFDAEADMAGASPMQTAARKRNWILCKAMEEGGARWMSGTNPSQSALAVLLSQVRIDLGGASKTEDLKSRKRAWTELESACVQGLADPETWMPVALLAELASRVSLRAGYDSASKAERLEARAFWKDLFERASKAGCHNWDKPIFFGKNIPDWARNFNLKIKNFNLPIALAEWALCAPEAWEAAARTPGFKVDSRSGWALSSKIGWEFRAGNDFKLRLKWSKQTAENLKNLNPWRDAFVLANELPEIDPKKYGSSERLDPGGWGSACADLLAQEESGAHEDGMASGIHLKAQRTLLNQLGELVFEIATWCKAKPGGGNWDAFKKEFGARLASSALSDKPDFTQQGPALGERDRVVADGPRVAIAAIGQLIPECESEDVGFEFELALAAHKGLADKIQECLAEGKGSVAHQYDEEICVEEMAQQSACLPWKKHLSRAVQEWVAPMASAYRRALVHEDADRAARAGLGLAWIESCALQVPEAPVRTKKQDKNRL